MKNSSCLLLLTACISPQITSTLNCKLTRSNALLRLQDYIIAFRYWLNYKDERIKAIVFVDNSGYDLSLLIDESRENPYGRKIEFIQYAQGIIPQGLHYGYAELDMVDKVIFDSKIIKSYTFVVKITGRLIFPKLSELFNNIHDDDEFIIDSRDYSFLTEQHYCVTTLFITKMDFYKNNLYNQKTILTQQEPYIEHLFFRVLKPLYLKHFLRITMRFPINLYPKGISGHGNVNYSSFTNKVKNAIRGLFRRLLPNIWI